MREWWSKVRMLRTGKRTLSAELQEEIEAHFEMEVENNRARGIPEEEARRLACVRFGRATYVQESAREAWAFTVIEKLAKDIGYAARGARKNPGFTITAVFTLALGIGGITAMFTLIRNVLLRPLDYPQPDQLLRILIGGPREGLPGGPFNMVRYREMQAATAFSGLAAAGIPETVTLSSGGSEPESLREARVSTNFLQVLGVTPLLGRGFAPEEDQPGGRNVALLSYDLWERRFSRNPNIVGRAISLGAQPFVVVGILPPHFAFPWSDYDVWVTRPWAWSQVAPEFWQRAPDIWGLARLKPGVTIAQARAELNVVSRQYALAHPELPQSDSRLTMQVERLEDSLLRDLRSLLWMLFDAVGFVLLIVCANVAGLLLARSAARSREFAVRSALGGGRGRLTQQMLTESVFLALAGAALGVVFAKGILAAMTRIGPLNLPRANEMHTDGVVLAFAAAISIATGLLFGWLPSLRFFRPDLAGFLREQDALAGRTSGVSSAGRIGMQGYLVIAQIALCAVLLTGAILLFESFLHLREVDPGFQPARLLTVEIALPIARYNTDQKKQAFWEDLTRRVKSLPGVSSAAVALSIPTTIPIEMVVQVAEQPTKGANRRPVVNIQSSTEEYFHTLGIPLVRGREFSEKDRAGAPRVAIINETMARQFWPSYPQGPSPLGNHLLSGSRATSWEIVGIVADVHEDALAEDVKPEMYFPCAQLPPQTGYLAVSRARASEGLVNVIRRELAAIDPGQSISQIQTMTQRLSASLGSRRLSAILLGSFAVVAILIALTGVYGVIAFLVQERTQEFGIRQALGAQRRDILTLVLSRGLRLVLTGLAIGLACAMAVAQLMRGMLFHVDTGAPWMFIGIAALFMIVGLGACYMPARRAADMDPVAALR
jgi:predicted permease